MQKFGKESYIQLFKMYSVINPSSIGKLLLDDFINSLESVKMKEFPIKGNDVVNLGFEGPEIKQAMSKGKDIWIESNCNLSKEEILDLLKKQK
jgi:hypothetical protein